MRLTRLGAVEDVFLPRARTDSSVDRSPGPGDRFDQSSLTNCTSTK